MNKAQLIEVLAQKSGLQKRKVKRVLDAYIDTVTETMSKKEELILIAVWHVIQRLVLL